MLKSIATWALLAVASVSAAPAPVNSLDSRDFEALEMEARDAGIDELVARDIEARVVSSGTANFERLNTSGLGVNQIGYYGGLQWIGIAAVSAGDGGLAAAIKPQSSPNVAAYGAITKLLNSKLSYITSNFNGSKTTSFGVSSFYFGCNGAVLTLPVGCKVSVAGYDAKNTLIAYKAFYFTPTDKGVQNMQLASLGAAFTDLALLRFATEYTGLNVLGSTVFDNVKYSINQTSTSVSASA